MPDLAGSFKRIYKPNADGTSDKTVFVDIPIVDKIVLRHGKGIKFIRRLIQFINHEKNDRRVVEVTRVKHKALNVDGSANPDDEDDDTQFVDYEKILKFTTKHGKGFTFFRHITELAKNKDTTDRKTHRRRIHGRDDTASGGKDNSDCWIDVERSDQIRVKHGKGFSFRREIYKVLWDDVGFEGTEKSSVPLHEGPQTDFDPPWRLDPLQNIVNVNWDDGEPGPYVVVKFTIWRRFYSTDGRLFNEALPGLPDEDDLLDPDVLEQSLITYTFAHPWPVIPGDSSPVFTSPPYDFTDPNEAITAGCTGMPSLPGLSAFGAGFECTFGAGAWNASPSQGESYTPGVRGTTSGVCSPTYPGVPDPPAYVISASWEAPAVSLQLYVVEDEVGGATIASTDLDYSGVSYTDPDGFNYAAIGAAVKPKEYGAVQHEPPFSGPPANLNSNNHIDVWVLLQITNPPPGYDP